MAKNKGKAEESEQLSGGLVFEEMAEGFAIPPKVDGGSWDTLVDKLVAAKPAVIKVFETEIEFVQRTYTRAKQLKAAADRKEKAITVAVRRLNGKSVLLAQAS